MFAMGFIAHKEYETCGIQLFLKSMYGNVDPALKILQDVPKTFHDSFK
jgi:hypothetical protein